MERPKRKRIRLKDYDYAQNGTYFLTVCAYEKRCLFGGVVGQGLCSCRLSPIGMLIAEEISGLEQRFSDIRIDRYVIMPNHMHLLLTIQRQGQSPCPTVGEIVGTLKSITTKRANASDRTPGRKIWQFRFHDRVV